MPVSSPPHRPSANRLLTPRKRYVHGHSSCSFNQPLTSPFPPQAAKQADQTVSGAAISGIEKGQEMAQKAKEVAGMSAAEAESKAKDVAGEAQGKAEELKGKAQGTAAEVEGKAKGAAAEAKGKAKQQGM